MNTSTVMQQSAAVNPKRVTGVAWAWGFEDGANGKSVYTGYHLFVGRKLSEYRRGWAEGRRNRR